MKMKGKNIFEDYLNLLGVRHTEAFSDQYFNEHPHKYNLFGLSKMLSAFGVENAATRITDKESDITEIQSPFIAQFSGDFVAVHKVESENVSFLWKGVRHVLPVAKFVNAWTGIVLLAETSEKSIEPDYKKHRKTELANLLKKVTLFSASGLIAVLAYAGNSGILPLQILPNQSHYIINVGVHLLLFVNFAGLYVSWLLLLKQMNAESRYADKICSLFKQKDCNNLLESEAAKLWGLIGWSEIGFGYFLTNVLALLFAPALIEFIALINMLTLPYAFWSVWYQKVKAKQWCVLCLLVQVLLWSIFIIDWIWGYIQLPVPLVVARFDLQSLMTFLFVGSCYTFSMLGINVLVPKFNSEKSVTSLKQSLNSMKADESVFTALLKQQPFYETDSFKSIIHFGNPDSKLRITVIGNPYCNPCAKMYKRVEDLLIKQLYINFFLVLYLLTI